MSTDQTTDILEAPVEMDEILQPVAPVREKQVPFYRRVLSRKLRPKKSKKKKPKWLVWTLWGVGLPGGLTTLFVVGWFGYAALDMPDTSPLWAPKTTLQIVILDRYGREILRKGGAEAKPVDL
ncbi:MAG: hypothetical protein L3J65_12730, partial [Robiginitomaculum sp.]|nr:hypothetical protein [Robiginitomaculum sp.]